MMSRWIEGLKKGIRNGGLSKKEIRKTTDPRMEHFQRMGKDKGH